MNCEKTFMGIIIAIMVTAFGLVLAYLVAIIWAIIKVTNHFAP